MFTGWSYPHAGHNSQLPRESLRSFEMASERREITHSDVGFAAFLTSVPMIKEAIELLTVLAWAKRKCRPCKNF